MKFLNNINKKVIILFVMSLFILPSTYGAYIAGPGEHRSLKRSSDAHPKERKYAILVRSTEHINASLKTAKQMREAGRDYAGFEVVICGKMVKELIDNKEMEGLLEEAKVLNVRFSVCGMSLNKFNIASSDLPEPFKVVDNGLIRIFDLQEEGYATIEL